MNNQIISAHRTWINRSSTNLEIGLQTNNINILQIRINSSNPKLRPFSGILSSKNTHKISQIDQSTFEAQTRILDKVSHKKIWVFVQISIPELEGFHRLVRKSWTLTISNKIIIYFAYPEMSSQPLFIMFFRFSRQNPISLYSIINIII